MNAEQHRTRASLLERVRKPEDARAWEEFYQAYWRLIYSFALKRGCSENMARDVLQESMMTLMKKLPDFEYDRSKGQFRSFLLRIVHLNMLSALRRERKHAAVSGHDPEDGFDLEALPDDRQEWEGVWEQDWQRHMLGRALETIQGRIQEATYKSFYMYCIEGRPVAEVCEEMGLERNTVYQHRNRVIGLLRDEVETLMQEAGD